NALRLAVTVLKALTVVLQGRPIVSGGIPWDVAPYGRDAGITGLQTLMVSPQIARDELRFLAAYQGRKFDDWTEEEPGRILHELRRGEMAACNEIPHVP